MKHTILSFIAAFLFGSVFGQAKLIEKVEKKGDELVIPYSKYELPNGLNDHFAR